MQTTTISVRIPQVTSLETAIRLYYERTELSNTDIRELFGNLGHSTVTRLKQKARELMQERGTPVWNAQRVNTEVAFEAWGLDIKRFEYCLKKLKGLNLRDNKTEEEEQ